MNMTGSDIMLLLRLYTGRVEVVAQCCRLHSRLLSPSLASLVPLSRRPANSGHPQNLRQNPTDPLVCWPVPISWHLKSALEAS